MYTINTTLGFIISSRSYGEAGKMFSIFTRDLGLVSVAAQGIRLEKSKLRYHMQEYSFGSFSLVRGKEFWRLTSSAPIVRFESSTQTYSKSNLGLKLSKNEERNELVVRIATLLRRLLHGEDPHPELFDCLETVVGSSLRVSSEHLPELESLTALRILDLLGYIGDSDIIRPFVGSQAISEELLSAMSPLRPKMNGIINASLQASHL